MEVKTVRFTEVVKFCGKPEQVTLWTAPEDNPDFMKAVQENRVVTLVLHNVGEKADYGLVGFFKQALTTFLTFAKRIPYPPETKIIGIKYDQIAESAPKGPVFKPAAKPPGIPMQEKRTARVIEEPEKPRVTEETKEQPSPPPAPKKPEPEVYHFQTYVDITATQRIPIEVEASSQKEAMRLAKKQVDAAQINLAEAKVAKKIGKLTRVK